MEDEPILIDEAPATEQSNNQQPEDKKDSPVSHDVKDLEDSGDTSEGSDQDAEKDIPDDKPSEEDTQDQSKSVSEMTEEQRREHNRQFAEQRIAAKREAEARNRDFISNLRQDLMREVVAELDDNKYEEVAADEGEREAEMQRRMDVLEQREQQRQVEAAMQRIEQQRDFIGMNIAQAESRIPLFNPESDQYREDLHSDAIRGWAAENLETIIDNAGNIQIVGMKDGALTPIEYLQEKASFYERILQSESARAQASYQRNRQAGESPSSAKAPVKSDSALEAFDAEFDKY